MTRTKEIRIGNGAVAIPAEAIEWQFVRSSGPGGQHVNRTSSKAVVRFPVAATACLPEDVRSRLLVQQRSRLTSAGELVISSQRHRDQPRNIADCIAKLSAIIERAAVKPKVRRPTKMPRAAIARRLDAKRRRAETKRSRGRPEP